MDYADKSEILHTDSLPESSPFIFPGANSLPIGDTVRAGIAPDSSLASLSEIVGHPISGVSNDEIEDHGVLQGVKKLRVADGRINFEKVRSIVNDFDIDLIPNSDILA
jgi:hypothetical protein